NSTTSSGLASSTWWGATDASGTALYAGFPVSSTQQTIVSTSTFLTTPQTVGLTIRADATPTTTAGSYSGNIIVTAMALP
ncbi:MAG: hypothetical protein WCF77_00375, partial [Minisyncoccia bacterium]